MGECSLALTGPISSTGWPLTFSTRPSVSGPTGTSTGCPRLMACMPRTRPSVDCSAMVRTRPSPMCCCTSQMMSMAVGTLKPSLVTRMAVYIKGMCPSGNSQSTAGPETWTTLPISNALVVAISLISLRGGGAADDFDDLFGDAGLPHAVHVESQPLDHVAGVGGGRIHGGHAGGMLGGGRFQQRAVKLHFDVARQQRGKHFRRRLFENIIHRGGLLGQLNRQQSREHDFLRHHALEFVVQKPDRVDLIVAVKLHRFAGDGCGIVEDHFRGQVDVLARDQGAALAEEIAALAADQLQL